MKIIQKSIDTGYLRFFSSYCESLISVSNDEWNYHIVSEAITYVLAMFFDDYFMNGIVPQRFENTEYFYDEDTACTIPPGCHWISKSGRFSCHHLDELIGGQGFILWDLKRRVVLPLIFHDLEGMDEENGIIFGRTMSPIHRHGICSPMAIDPEWINVLRNCKSIPGEYPAGEPCSLSDDELSVIAQEGVKNLRNKKDLFEYIEFPGLEVLSRKNIQLLDQEDISEKMKKDLAGEILFHPHFHNKHEDWVFDALFDYTGDMDKCYTIAAWFGFEDIIDKAYDDWQYRMKKRSDYKRQNHMKNETDERNEDHELPF